MPPEKTRSQVDSPSMISCHLTCFKSPLNETIQTAFYPSALYFYAAFIHFVRCFECHVTCSRLQSFCFELQVYPEHMKVIVLVKLCSLPMKVKACTLQQIVQNDLTDVYLIAVQRTEEALFSSNRENKCSIISLGENI